MKPGRRLCKMLGLIIKSVGVRPAQAFVSRCLRFLGACVGVFFQRMMMKSPAPPSSDLLLFLRISFSASSSLYFESEQSCL